MSDPAPIERTVLGERIARAIAPEAWADFDRTQGKGMTIMHGWSVIESIEAAGRIVDLLHEEMPDRVPPRAEKISG